MGTPTSSTVKINLSSGILEHSEREAARIGISLQDFIRMLMATYFANSGSVRAISRDQALYNRARREIKEEMYTSVRNEKELDTHLDALVA